MIKLGSKVRDVYTGFTGIAVARTEWIHGCARITIEPTETKDGKLLDSATFDEPRIEVLEELDPVIIDHGEAQKPGGQQKDPQRSKDPTR